MLMQLWSPTAVNFNTLWHFWRQLHVGCTCLYMYVVRVLLQMLILKCDTLVTGMTFLCNYLSSIRFRSDMLPLWYYWSSIIVIQTAYYFICGFVCVFFIIGHCMRHCMHNLRNYLLFIAWSNFHSIYIWSTNIMVFIIYSKTQILFFLTRCYCKTCLSIFFCIHFFFFFFLMHIREQTPRIQMFFFFNVFFLCCVRYPMKYNGYYWNYLEFNIVLSFYLLFNFIYYCYVPSKQIKWWKYKT